MLTFDAVNHVFHIKLLTIFAAANLDALNLISLFNTCRLSKKQHETNRIVVFLR